MKKIKKWEKLWLILHNKSTVHLENMLWCISTLKAIKRNLEQVIKQTEVNTDASMWLTKANMRNMTEKIHVDLLSATFTVE